LKIHLAVNIKTKEILSLEVTDEKVHDDSKVMSKLIDDVSDKGIRIKKAFADGAYDTNANFIYLPKKNQSNNNRVRSNAINL